MRPVTENKRSEGMELTGAAKSTRATLLSFGNALWFAQKLKISASASLWGGIMSQELSSSIGGLDGSVSSALAPSQQVAKKSSKVCVLLVLGSAGVEISLSALLTPKNT